MGTGVKRKVRKVNITHNPKPRAMKEQGCEATGQVPTLGLVRPLVSLPLEGKSRTTVTGARDRLSIHIKGTECVCGLCVCVCAGRGGVQTNGNEDTWNRPGG